MRVDVSEPFGVDEVSEPTGADLAAIEEEWPLIAAELDLLDAEIALLYAADRGGPTELDWQRVRRARRQVLRTAANLFGRPTIAPLLPDAA